MTLRKSTRYALYAAMELARVGDGSTLSASHVAGRYGIPGTVLSKVFQQLVRAGLVVGTRGVHGGYSLIRPASEITVLDLIQAFEPPRTPDQCLLADHDDPTCSRHQLCRLRQLFDEVDELTRGTYASMTLDALVVAIPPDEGPLRTIP